MTSQQFLSTANLCCHPFQVTPPPNLIVSFHSFFKNIPFCFPLHCQCECMKRSWIVFYIFSFFPVVMGFLWPTLVRLNLHPYNMQFPWLIINSFALFYIDSYVNENNNWLPYIPQTCLTNMETELNEYVPKIKWRKVNWRKNLETILIVIKSFRNKVKLNWTGKLFNPNISEIYL